MKHNLDTEPAKPKGPAQDYRNNLPCWRSFCEDLIYAAAHTGGEGYLNQAVARKPHMTERERATCLRYGDALRDALRADHPDDAPLRRAQRAWDNPDGAVAQYGRWLPKRPLDGQALVQSERNRRSGITEEQRQANADQVAASL